MAILLDEPLLVDCTEDRPIIQSLPTQLASATEESGKSKKPDTTTFAIWVNDGTRIITGTEKGYLNVINPSNRQIESRHQAAGGTITSIKFHEPSNTILINSGDKVIRKLSVTKLLDPKNPSASPAIRYEDMINHLSWNNMCYSHTGDYVVASIYMQWKAYIWEHHTGSLVKIIEGPSEELGAIESHPSRPLICAAGIESGAIYVWSIIQPQRWAALAPDFVEVEENEEYEEREDEFDVQDEEMVRRRRLEREDEEVDVLTISEDVLRAMGNRLPRRLQNHAGSGMESTGAKDEEPFVLPLLLEVDDSGAEEARIGAKQKPIGDDGRGRGQGSGSGRSSQSNSRPPTPGEEQAEVQSCTSSQTVSRDVSQHRHVNGVNNGTGKSSVKGSVRSGSKPGTSKGKKRKKRPDLPL